MMNNAVTPIVVLNDGETFTDANGCVLTAVTEDEVEWIEDQLLAERDNPLAFFRRETNGRVTIELTDYGHKVVDVI